MRSNFMPVRLHMASKREMSSCSTLCETRSTVVYPQVKRTMYRGIIQDSRGRNSLMRADGSSEALPHGAVVELDAGGPVIIETPGRGGFGRKAGRDKQAHFPR